jgi:hypothetical protein
MAEETQPGLWTDPESVPKSLSKGNAKPPSYIHAMDESNKRRDNSTYFMRKVGKKKGQRKRAVKK